MGNIIQLRKPKLFKGVNDGLVSIVFNEQEGIGNVFFRKSGYDEEMYIPINNNRYSCRGRYDASQDYSDALLLKNVQLEFKEGEHRYFKGILGVEGDLEEGEWDPELEHEVPHMEVTESLRGMNTAYINMKDPYDRDLGNIDKNPVFRKFYKAIIDPRTIKQIKNV